MENQKPILSICLPTNGEAKWVIPTIESIYAQNVDYALFEVVVTDNGENSKLGDILKMYDYPNLRYIQTTDKGFLNLVTCLKEGRGLFCKMLNHRMMLKPNMLPKMINVINIYKETKPIMYFLNGSLKLPEFTICNDLDVFVYNMHYWISWSAGIGFWDTDLLKLSTIKLNDMFPNTSLLLECRQKSRYIIWNGIYGHMQDEKGKGGYNLFKTFAVDYLDILTDLRVRNRISISTFLKVKKELYSFLRLFYFKTIVKKEPYTFDLSNIAENMSVYYTKWDYLKMKWYAKSIMRLKMFLHR